MAKQAIPKNETPEARFKRMAQARVNKSLKQIALLGNLAGSRYKSSPDQHTKMQKAFEDALNTAFARLKGQKTTKETFSL